MTFPRSIWTPDIVPAAAVYDIDCYMDAFALATQAAMVSSKIRIGIVATDCLRRPPAVLAQSFLTIDHIAKGRAFFCLGAGEIKQFAPHSLPRDKPFAHMEESIKIIRLLGQSKGLVNYDGPIWQLKNAILAFQPYNDRMPPLMVAAGPGRGLEIAGQCDLRICGRSARFGAPINKLGFSMAPGELIGLLALVGPAVTLEILLEGRILGADEAYEKGLVSRVVDDELVAEEAYATARRIAAGAPLAARMHKKLVRRLTAVPQGLTLEELKASFAFLDSEDYREGLSAFLEKRSPVFRGR